MFDIIDARIIFSQREFCNKKDKINKIESNCLHDLILCYFNETTNPTLVKRANCLICGKSFKLKDDFDLKVNGKLVIDITDKVSLHSQNLFVGIENVLVIKAKEVLKDIMYDPYYKTLNEIKQLIVDELISYDKNLVGNQLKKSLIKRY